MRFAYIFIASGSISSTFLLNFIFLVSTSHYELLVSAQDEASAQDYGSLVKFEVANVGGVAGKTGQFIMQLRPDWAPIGVARFEELASISFYDQCRVFRAIPDFVAQFGINGDPVRHAAYVYRNIMDDPVLSTNARGTVAFAMKGPNTRTTQIFINTRLEGNTFLDQKGFAPIGEIVDGMDVVDLFYSGYGESPPDGTGPDQSQIQSIGNKYLKERFPLLSYFTNVTFIIRKEIPVVNDAFEALDAEGKQQINSGGTRRALLGTLSAAIATSFTLS